MSNETPIIWFESIDSTNLEARRNMSDIDTMRVYAAKFQTAGRGQRGNKWLSSAGENLTFSIAVKPDDKILPVLQASEQFLISVISTLTIDDYLDSIGIRSEIKWPNDIYVRNKKICGMLIENGIGSQGLCSSIIGIGLNLNQTEFSPELMNPTSVRLISGLHISPEAALPEIIALFSKRASQLFSPGGKEALVNDFEHRMYRRGLQCRYRDNISEEEFAGTIKGISEEGLLLMEMPDNKLRKYSFKEVSYII